MWCVTTALPQPTETVAAINDKGVIPVLLKGAAMLATVDRPHWGSRLMSDLDILVSHDEIDATLDAFSAVGYSTHFLTPPSARKWFTELKRPSDVGMVDLHRELPGPAFFLSLVGRRAGTLQESASRARVGAYPVRDLSGVDFDHPRSVRTSDYWTGNFDMRHLMELRDLAASPEGIDWETLAAFTPSKLARNALETQLVALFRLLGVDVPAGMRNRFVPRLQHGRRLAQGRHPLSRQALLPIAFLDLRNYRLELGPSIKAGAIDSNQKWALPKSDTLRFLLALSRDQRAGKL